MPPSLFGYADYVTKYPYDPAKAKSLLQQAGVQMPFQIDFWYPTDVSRPYMPDPKRNFEAFAASLNKSGFKVVPHSAPWSPDYLGAAQEGKAGLCTCSAGRATSETRITSSAPSSSSRPTSSASRTPEITTKLNEAESETDEAKRTTLYQEANRMIMEFLPGVPYVHTEPAMAFDANVKGYVPSPVSLEQFSIVYIEE